MNKLLAGQLEFIREYECKTEDERKAMLEAIEVVQDAQKKEEINQSLLYEYENERLLKSVQEIKAEIKKELCHSIRDEYSQRQNDYCDGVEFAGKRCLEIIDKHMSWEGEDV